MRFVILIGVLLGLTAPASAQTLEQQLQSMRTQAFAVPGSIVTEYPDFTMVEDRANLSIFYLTKPGHYAHPAAVVRTVVQQPDGAWVVRYTTWPYRSPENAPPAFIRWMEEFAELDRAMQAEIMRDKR